MVTVCFTGHRPSSASLGGYDWYSRKNIKIMKAIRKEVLKLINSSNEDCFHFIFGGALGIDQMAFAVVLKIKKELLSSKNIELEIAVPFKEQFSAWFREDDIVRYNSQLSLADKITYVDTLESYIIPDTVEGKYSPLKLQRRNEYMVDNSDLVIAIFDGKKGGTYNCVSYAKKIFKDIIIINPILLD